MKQSYEITFDDTAIIRASEGCSLTAYPDPVSPLGKACTKAKISLFKYKNLPGWEKLDAAPWTVGYGLTGDWIKQDTVITEQESKDKYLAYIKTFCNDLDKLVQVELSKNPYIALLSLMWNIGKGNLGKSTLLKKLNVKDFDGAKNEFLVWNKAGGQVLAGLTTRRQKESDLFASGDHSTSLADAVKNLDDFASKA